MGVSERIYEQVERKRMGFGGEIETSVLFSDWITGVEKRIIWGLGIIY